MTPMRRGGVWFVGATATLVLAITTPEAFAAGQSLSLSVGLRSLYDTNILQYSGAQIDSFEAGTRPYQYAIETRDDLVWNPSVALGWENAWPGGRRRSLRLKGDGDFHQKNQTVDYRSVSLAWREGFPGGHRLSVSLFELPHYYLRQLFNPEEPVAFRGLSKFRYRRAEFGLTIGSASWSQRVGPKTRLEAAYQFERRAYNPDFRERDSRLYQGMVGMGLSRLPRRGTLGLSAGYRTSHARGGRYVDPLSAPRDTIAAFPDVSYHGLVSELTGALELVRTRQVRVTTDLAYQLETRSYDSKLPSDKFHFGRDDVLNALEVGLRASLRPHWSVRGSYRFEINHAHFGGNVQSTTDPGSYRVHQIGLALDWTGTLWRRRGVGPEPGDEP